MKNKARPLSVDRLGAYKTSKLHFKLGLRGWNIRWKTHPFCKEHESNTRKQYLLNDDCN